MVAVLLVLAVVLANLANLALYWAVTQILDQPLLMPKEFPPPEVTPLGTADVVMFTTIFGTGAVAIYAVLRSLVPRPLRAFSILATVILPISFVLPGAIPSPPVEWSAKLALMSMHVVGYLAIMATLLVGHARGWLSTGR